MICIEPITGSVRRSYLGGNSRGISHVSCLFRQFWDHNLGRCFPNERILRPRSISVFATSNKQTYTGRTKVMLLESSYCKPFPPLNLKRGDNWPCHTCHAKWTWEIDPVQTKSWHKPSTSANFLPVEVCQFAKTFSRPGAWVITSKAGACARPGCCWRVQWCSDVLHNEPQCQKTLHAWVVHF